MKYITIDALKKRHDEVYLSKCKELIPEYNALIDQIGDEYSKIEFFFSIPASRNLYHSRIFEYMVEYHFLIEILKNYNYSVIVESRALSKLMRNAINTNNLRGQVSCNYKVLSTRILKSFFRFWSLIIKVCKIKSLAYCLTSTSMEHEIQNEKKKVVIETFFTNSSFKECKYVDRYFGDLFDSLEKSGRNNIFILPNFLGIEDLRAFKKVALKNISKTGKKFIFKENYFSYFDYLKIFARLFYMTFLLDRKILKRHFFGELIREELLLSAFNPLSFEAFLNYKFIKITAENNLNIDMIVEWNENHINDRALAKSVKDFQSSIKLKSYQPAILDPVYDFFLYPTILEIKHGLFSRNLIVTKSALDLNLSSLKNLINVEIGPHFRMKKIYEVKKCPKGKTLKVLVALPLMETVAKNILNLMADVYVKCPNVEFIVRKHPQLKLDIKNLGENISLDANVDVYKSLEEVDVLIGSSTSLCMEACCLGVAVIVVRELGTICHNTIPLEIRDIFSIEASDPLEISAKLQEFANKDDQFFKDLRELGKKIRSEYIQEFRSEDLKIFTQ